MLVWVYLQTRTQLARQACRLLRPRDGPRAETWGPAATRTTQAPIQVSISSLRRRSELGVFVEKLQRLCPAAIEEESKDEMEINIDKIDVRTFRELDRYVTECLAKK